MTGGVLVADDEADPTRPAIILNVPGVGHRTTS